MVLLTHEFVPGQPNEHRFPAVTANRLKIVVEECIMEQNGALAQ